MASDNGYMTETATPAPRITATHLRQALATAEGVVVQDATSGDVYALPHGLTKLQATDGNLVVILTNAEAVSYLHAAEGHHGRAAQKATTILAWELELIDTRLAGWSALGGTR